MNIRATRKKRETYKDFVDTVIQDYKKINKLLGITLSFEKMEKLHMYIDFLLDTREAIERILGRSIEWIEFDTYFHYIFSQLSEKIKYENQKDTIEFLEYKIYLELGRLLNISVPDNILANVLKKSRDTIAKNDKKLTSFKIETETYRKLKSTPKKKIDELLEKNYGLYQELLV